MSNTGVVDSVPVPKRKRKSRWSEAPTKDEQEVATVINSFSNPLKSQLTPEQFRQLLEQQEVLNKSVCYYLFVYIQLNKQKQTTCVFTILTVQEVHMLFVYYPAK